MLLSLNELFAQTRNQLYLDYIAKYQTIAIQQMKEYGVPASITLAQGLLESGGGRSDLAVKGNNHFGIKCGGSWMGRTMTHDDDKNGECFRVYNSAEESFRDHSVFLQKARYKKLFNYDRSDYKSWARGLKECGYATSPTYANRLIQIIELYELHAYDKESKAVHYVIPPVETKPLQLSAGLIGAELIVFPNGIPYIISGRGETLEYLSKKYGISERKIRKYNDLPKGYDLKEGSIVYLAKKKTKASKEFRKKCWHQVSEGQSMYDISQMYGIRLKSLYSKNFKSSDYVPKAGELLKIR